MSELRHETLQAIRNHLDQIALFYGEKSPEMRRAVETFRRQGVWPAEILNRYPQT